MELPLDGSVRRVRYGDAVEVAAHITLIEIENTNLAAARGALRIEIAHGITWINVEAFMDELHGEGLLMYPEDTVQEVGLLPMSWIPSVERPSPDNAVPMHRVLKLFAMSTFEPECDATRLIGEGTVTVDDLRKALSEPIPGEAGGSLPLYKDLL